MYTPETDLIEFVCAENEKDSKHLIGTKFDDLKNAVKLTPELLTRYTGRYKLRAEGRDLEIQIALVDGDLKWGLAGAPNRPLIPLSETRFAYNGGYMEFGRNENGEIYLVLQTPEGDTRANRKKGSMKRSNGACFRCSAKCRRQYSSKLPTLRVANYGQCFRKYSAIIASTRRAVDWVRILRHAHRLDEKSPTLICAFP